MKPAYAPSKEGPAREELVRHLVRCMERDGMVIEAADLPGHNKPGALKRGLIRSRLKPDAVARDGRRIIFGIAASGAEIAGRDLPPHLEALAGKCRMLVVCVPNDRADEVVDAVLRGGQVPSWRKLRLLSHPMTKWAEVPKPATAVGRRLAPVVRLRDDEER